MQKENNLISPKLFYLKKYFNEQKFLSVSGPNIFAVISYIFLTIVFTYPVFFSNMVPGEGDVYFYLWDLWWFKKALLSASSPYFTQYFFYPTGLNLAFSAITPFNGIISIPLQFMFGLTKTYTILWLISFVISGYGTYLLVNYLTGNSKAAFISGLIFMFSPYHFAHSLGHLNLLSIEWIPFYVMFFFKTVNEKSSTNAIYAAFFLLLVFLSEYTYFIYLSLFTIFFLLYYICEDKSYVINKYVVKRLFLLGISFTILFLPFVYPLLKELLTSKSSYMYSGGFVTYSADLLGFFIPSKFHPIFNQFVIPMYQNFTGNYAEFTVFAGYTVLILSTIAFLKIKTKEIKFWVLATAICFIFCLGPLLHINGLFTGTIENIKFAIPLPYAIIMKIPIVSIARVTGRWDAIVMLNLSVLSGYGLSYIYEKFENHSFKRVSPNTYITIIFASLILFEFLSIPYPMANTNVPEFYHSLSNNSEDFAILEVPEFGYHLAFPEYVYYQTVHEKRLITGYTHVPESAMKFTENTPFINSFFMYGNYQKYVDVRRDILNQNITEVGPSILNHYNIKYIILHENLMTADELTSAKRLLERSLGKDPVYYKNDSMFIYEVSPCQEKTFLLLGDGWYGLENLNGVPSRWMSADSSIYIYSDVNRSVKFSLNALSFQRPVTLDISEGYYFISGFTVPPNNFVHIETPISLHQGENIIKFHIPEGCEIPNKIQGFKGSDDRCLSVLIQNITIT